jgi:aspartyl/asparaginyl beta-hydroxylase (cupin superfamily)
MVETDRNLARSLIIELNHWSTSNQVPYSALSRVIEALEQYTGQREEVEPFAQNPRFRLPGLTAKPWYGVGEFPWAAAIEAQAPLAVDEYQSLVAQKSLLEHPEAQKLATGGIWRQLYFYQSGVAYQQNLSMMPETAELICAIPGATECSNVFLSIIGPGCRIRPHYGPHNLRIRCHLGLSVPEGCAIRVGAATRSWSKGHFLIFDDSFEHEVWNDHVTDERGVLIVDVWHPEVSVIERAAILHLNGLKKCRGFSFAV